MIFEQLAYCINISDVSDNEFIKFSKNKIKYELSSTNINKLRRLITDTEIGKMYSYLSELTHIDYKHMNKYISYDNDIKSVMITLKNINQSIESALLLLHVVDIHSIVLEYSLKKYIKNGFKYIINNEPEIRINKNRPMKININKFNQEFSKIKKELKLPVHNNMYRS